MCEGNAYQIDPRVVEKATVEKSKNPILGFCTGEDVLGWYYGHYRDPAAQEPYPNIRRRDGFNAVLYSSDVEKRVTVRSVENMREAGIVLDTELGRIIYNCFKECAFYVQVRPKKELDE